MRPENVRSFARRDWEAVAEAKADAWLEQRRLLGIEWALRVADDLLRQAQALHPDWPSEEERAIDLAMHARVAEVLRRATRARCR